MKIKNFLLIKLCLGIIFIVSFSKCSLSQEFDKDVKKESVLDKISHVEDQIIWEIPDVPRLCDELNFNGKKIDIGDCKLYVEEEGKGTPIVLLHGGPGSTHHYFHPVMSEITKFARIIYYDQRGCGLSDYEPGDGYSVEQAAADLDKLREKLSIDKWIVLGHSYGGFLGQYYTAHYPEHVSGLVIVCGGTGLHNIFESRQWDYMSSEERTTMRAFGNEIRKRAKDENWPYDKTLALRIYNNFMNGDWKRQTFYKPTKEECAYSGLYEWNHDFEANFNSVMSQSMRSVSLQGLFKNNPIPTIIMESLWDLTWDEKKAMILHKNHPNAEMIIFSKSGHSPFADEPEKFFSYLKEFAITIKPVANDEILKYKQEISGIKFPTNDPFITSQVSEIEREEINKYQTIANKIIKGEEYMDLSSPLNCYLSFLSSAQHLNVEKAKITQERNWNTKELKDIRTLLTETEVWRVPKPPVNPQPAQILPIYLIDKKIELFFYQAGSWGPDQSEEFIKNDGRKWIVK